MQSNKVIMQSNKVTVKPKIYATEPSLQNIQNPSNPIINDFKSLKSTGKPTVISIPLTTTISGGKTILSSNLSQPTRILMPEKQTKEEEEEEEQEEEQDEEEEEDEEDEEDEEQEEQDEEEEHEEDVGSNVVKSAPQVAPKRKPRTKKTYPPSDTMFDQLIKNLCELRETTRKVITLTRETQKCINRETRELKNQLKKQKGEQPQRKPRGFGLPSLVSREMVDYLLNVAKITEVDRKVKKVVVGQIKIEHGCELARNELTSALCQHFRDSGMRKNELDHRDIHLDSVTSKLFGIDIKKYSEDGGRISILKEPVITYFDLQKYLPNHCGVKAIGH